MAFRIETNALSGLSWLSLMGVMGSLMPPILAQTYTYEVRHQHWRGGAMGTLEASPDSLSFEEHGKKNKTDSRQWRFEEIQQLTVGASEFRILTYEDSKWKLGRDREYIFDHLPAELATQLYPLLTRRLDQRFIAALSNEDPVPEWKVGAKLGRGLKGTLGTLVVSRDLIVFNTEKPNEARSWRITDIENISRSGPLDLAITTSEKTGMFRGGDRQFHFQLQQNLSEERYNALWREINRSKGLTFLDSQPRGAQ